MTRTNGSFTGTSVWQDQAASADKTISSQRHDTHDQDMATEMTDSLSRSGKGAMLAALDMGGNRVINVADATAGSDTPRLDQVVPYGTPAASQPNNTGTADLPEGTDAQRPASPSSGEIRYNTTNSRLEFWNGTLWQEVPGLNVANTFTENQTIDSANGASGTTQFDVKGERTTAGNAAELRGFGHNAAADDIEYGSVVMQVVDSTTGSEDGAVGIKTPVAGTSAERLLIKNGVYSPGATDGDKGADSANFSEYYEDGVRVITTPGEVVDREIPLLTDTDEETGIDVGPYKHLTAGAIGLSTSSNGDDTIIQLGDSTDYTTDVTYVGQTIDESGTDITSWNTKGGIVIACSTSAASVMNVTVFMRRLADSIAVSLFGTGYIGWAVQVGQQRNDGSGGDRGYGSGYFGTSKTIDRARIVADSNFTEIGGRWYISGS